MKNLIIALFITVSTSIYAQDTEMLGFINQYRIFNSKSALVWSCDLAKVSKTQTAIIIKQDSLSHSHVTTEIATMGSSLPSTNDEKIRFIGFLKSVFDIDYIEPENDTDVVKYVKLYAIYMFDQSPKHKVILLGDYKSIGFDIITTDIKFKSNVIKIGDKTIEYKNFVSHYEVKFYVVMNFKSV